MFAADWFMAKRGHGLEKWIINHDDEGGGVWRDADGNGTHDEVDEVKDVLFRYHRVIYGAFDYYCALMALDGDIYSGKAQPPVEADMFSMTFNAYLEWARDCNLVSRSLMQRDLQVVWVQVNAIEESTKDLDRQNKQILVHSCTTNTA